MLQGFSCRWLFSHSQPSVNGAQRWDTHLWKLAFVIVPSRLLWVQVVFVLKEFEELLELRLSRPFVWKPLDTTVFLV